MDKLQSNTALIRRHYIRRTLTEEWMAGRGMRTLESIQEAVERKFGLRVDRDLVKKDLDAMHAVKIEQAGFAGTFWIVPPWRMDMENVARLADQTTVLNEVQHRLTGYALDSMLLGERIIIKTDRHCGRMIGEWIALLDWPEIGHVTSHDHSVEVLCLREDYAQLVHAKLLGDLGIVLLADDE